MKENVAYCRTPLVVKKCGFQKKQGNRQKIMSELAAMYDDRLLLLKNGGVEIIGTPQEVLTYERLERSYGCVVLVEESSLGKFPWVTPMPGKPFA